jgi:hypothetical protein
MEEPEGRQKCRWDDNIKMDVGLFSLKILTSGDLCGSE